MLSVVLVSDCLTPDFIQPHLLFVACISFGRVEAASSSNIFFLF